MLTEPPADGVPRTSPPRWLTEEEQRAWRTYVRLAQLLMRQLDRDLHSFGLSMHDYEILVELSEAPLSRMRMTELADRTAQSRSRLSHQINRMETRGLVSREGCEGDKRGTFAVLTTQGMATIGKVAPCHVASIREHFIDQLDPAQLTALTDACEPVLENLRLIRDHDMRGGNQKSTDMNWPTSVKPARR